MEFLKSILGDELYAQVETKVNEHNEQNKDNKENQVKIANLSTGRYVDKMKYTSLETKLNEANTTIADLKKNNKDNEELQNTIKEHETKIKDLEANHKAELEKMTKENAIKELLYNSKAKHSDLLLSKFDLSKIIVNADKSLTGIDEQFKNIKENYKDLFEETKTAEQKKAPYSYIPAGGNSNITTGATDFVGIIKENQSRKI